MSHFAHLLILIFNCFLSLVSIEQQQVAERSPVSFLFELKKHKKGVTFTHSESPPFSDEVE